MVTVARELVVFVASPGDCDDERQRVRLVAERINEVVGSLVGIRLRVTGWEDVPPDFGRPQGRINPLVDECDIFVGLLGYRWGTPTGTHESGFLEEFERATDRRRSVGGRPHVALYFRTVPGSMASDPGVQLREVLNFQQRLASEHVALYRSFVDVVDLERQLWELFARLIVSATNSVDQPPEGASGRTATPVTDVSTAQAEDAEMNDARRQISEVSETLLNAARGGPIKQPIDRDRLLLVALAFNDDGGLLPAHVANRLYRRQSGIDLVVIEGRLWLRSIAADIGQSPSRTARAVPGWALVGVIEDDMIELLVEAKDDQAAIGVFRILQRLARRPAALWPAEGDSTDAALERWKALIARPAVAEAAAEYVAILGTGTDAPLLDLIADQHEGDSLGQIRSLVLGDASPLAEAVAASYFTPTWKLDHVMKNLALASDAALRTLVVSSRVSAELRRAAFCELDARSLVEAGLLKTLISDSALTDAIFEAAARPQASLKLEAIAAIAAEVADTSLQISEVRARARAATSNPEQLLAQLSPTGFNVDIWEALGWTRDPSLVNRARTVLDSDGDEIVAPLVDKPGWKDDPKVLAFLRARARVSALQILVSAKPLPEEDRLRLHAELSKNDLFAREDCVLMLASVATNEDVPTLLGQLSNSYGNEKSSLVDAILRIGGTVSARKLIEGGDSEQAAKAVTVLGGDPEVATEELGELLYSPIGEVRIAALDEIVKRSSTDALDTLREDYPKHAGMHYYNVVVELDWLRFAAATEDKLDNSAT